MPFSAALIGSELLKFWDSLSVPPSSVNGLPAWPLTMGPTGRPETSVTNCQSKLETS
jgi:hypothetical protein